MNAITAMRLGAAAAIAASATFSTVARAEAIDDLRRQIETLTQKVAELERTQLAPTSRDSNGPSSASAVSGGATKGSFKLPGSDTSITIGGYVKADAVFSDRSAGVGSTADQEYEAGAVPVGPNAGADERGQLKLHARQSRFFLQTSTPSSWGDASTYLEFDLFGSSGNESVSNSHNLRLRHAYATLGGLLVGQTWTTFADTDVYPETLDFGGPAGQIFARQAQVRWTQPFASGQWSIALENPETVVALPGGDAFRADDDRFPDIAGNIRFRAAGGKYSLAGIVRQIRVDSGSAPAARAARWGGALGANGVVAVGQRDDVRLSAYYGNAIGRYSTGFFSDGVLDADAHLALPAQWAALAALRHYWSPRLRTTLALSALRADNPPGAGPTVNRSAASEHLNLIWSPIAKANLGVEYLHATRTVDNGQSGRLNRLQASAQYFF